MGRVGVLSLVLGVVLVATWHATVDGLRIAMEESSTLRGPEGKDMLREAVEDGRVWYRNATSSCKWPHHQVLPTSLFQLPPTPECEQKPFATFDEENKLTMTCDGPASYYVNGEAVTYKEPVKLEQDTVFVKCGEKKDILVNVKKNTRLVDSAKTANKPSTAPNIVLLFLDALSHNHANRAFTQTLSLLDSKEFKTTYKSEAFRFSMFQSVRHWTDPNFFAISSGDPFMTDRDENTKPEWVFPGYDKDPYQPPANVDDVKFFPCENCIWNKLKDIGYVSGFGTDSGQDERTCGLLGLLERNKNRHIYHLMQQVYKDAGERNGRNEGKCVGSKTEGERLTEFGSKFLKTYADNPRFLFLHFLSGHEDPMGFSRLDKIVAEFTKKTLADYPNTMFIMMGDHGSRHGLKKIDLLESELELKNPFLYVTVPNNFLENFPEARKNIAANTATLVTAYDLYSTMRAVTSKDGSYTADNGYGKSLFTPLPTKRSCDDAKVNFACVCNPVMDTHYRYINDKWLKVKDEISFHLFTKIENQVE